MDAEMIVRAKLADAGLTLSEAELARYMAGYPDQRAAVDSLLRARPGRRPAGDRVRPDGGLTWAG